MLTIAVGSKNPTKINAAKIAFVKAFPHEEITVVGFDVSSGVPDQPIGDKETMQGATTRAQKALDEGKADFGVGEEGGMSQMDDKWFETGWCAVVDAKGIIGMGSSIRMEVPEKLLTHIHAGKELGVATDIAFETIDSGKKTGFFGLMTNEGIDRTQAYADGITSALARFLHPHLF